VSDLLDLYLGLVGWLFTASDRVVDGLGLDGGHLDRLLGWMGEHADVVIAAAFGAVGIAIWAGIAGGFASWIDRRVRARMEGRLGPRHWGVGGLLQGWAHWLKLMLKRRPGSASASAGVLSGGLVVAALAMMPLGPWGRLVDPTWGLPVAATLLVLGPLPLAAVGPLGEKVRGIGSVVASGAVLILAIAAPLLVSGASSADGIVSFQREWGWFVLVTPLGFVLFMYAYWLEAGRMAAMLGTAPSYRSWPGPRLALVGYVMAARHFALGVLGALVFLGGWSGPGPDGLWWTLTKAFLLVVLASLLSAAMPMPRSEDINHRVRAKWLTVAAINLVVAAGILEVMA
jgi:NADH-quinone oxidoreductase subunit H